MVPNATFNNISVVAVSFIVGGKRSTPEETTDLRKPLTNFIT